MNYFICAPQNAVLYAHTVYQLGTRRSRSYFGEIYRLARTNEGASVATGCVGGYEEQGAELPGQQQMPSAVIWRRRLWQLILAFEISESGGCKPHDSSKAGRLRLSSYHHLPSDHVRRRDRDTHSCCAQGPQSQRQAQISQAGCVWQDRTGR